MEWTKAISEAIEYIERNLTEDISVEDIARQVNISPFYFQRGFGMLCGFTISEYIRNRRLALAAEELAAGNLKVIDAAVKYCYDSPDSFTKAFYRFHGVTPSMVQKNSTMIKSFAPLKIQLLLKGGYTMDYKIVKKESFSVLGAAKTFTYENAKQEIPQFWNDLGHLKNGNLVCGMFGVNLHPSDVKCGGEGEFEYLIADLYNPAMEIPEGLTVRTIPALTWVVFPITGPAPEALQDVNTKIFSEWLPAITNYEFDENVCIEMYDLPTKYPKGVRDENYYTEIWVSVKKK